MLYFFNQIRETKKSIYFTPVFLNLAYIVNSSTSSRSEASEYIFDPVIAVILDPITFKGIVHTVIVVILGPIMFKGIFDTRCKF